MKWTKLVKAEEEFKIGDIVIDTRFGGKYFAKIVDITNDENGDIYKIQTFCTTEGSEVAHSDKIDSVSARVLKPGEKYLSFSISDAENRLSYQKERLERLKSIK